MAMSKGLSEEIVTPLKQLIYEISGFDEGTEPFIHILKYFSAKLKKADNMYFSSKREIDQNISSMSEKFSFHGFFPQAEALKSAYKLYFSEVLPKSEMMTRLNVVKFLLCISDSPTKHFLEHPGMIVKQLEEPEDAVDWAAYLNEGIEKWNPYYDESSDNESYISLEEQGSREILTTNYSDPLLPTQIKSLEKMCIMDFKTNREELLATIQHSWYNDDQYFIEPESQWREANIGILWENYLKDHVQGLILLKSPSFISEYKVIREILWQMWCPHTSCTLELSGNTIRPRPDVTIASIRSYAFYTFMEEFVPYIEVLDYFREFERCLQNDLDGNNHHVCRTYQSYYKCIKSIIQPVYEKLSKLEDEVRLQETTFTMLKLADELKTIFKPVKLIKEIHDRVILDHAKNSPLKCASSLITRLHESLNFTSNKIEQDLKLSLFLESVYHYLNLIDSWLMKDDLADYTGEFVIENFPVNQEKRLLWLSIFDMENGPHIPRRSDICSDHFSPYEVVTCDDGRRHIKLDAIPLPNPSIFVDPLSSSSEYLNIVTNDGFPSIICDRRQDTLMAHGIESNQNDIFLPSPTVPIISVAGPLRESPNNLKKQWEKIPSSSSLSTETASESRLWTRKITTDQWHTQFMVRENIEEKCMNNTFLKIFMEKILKIGKNINFLRLLGKYDIIGNCEDSIYDEFIKNVFEQLNKFDNVENIEHVENNKEREIFDLCLAINEQDFIFPVVGSEICKINPDVQKLENLVDVDDGFLMAAFADFFVKKPTEAEKEKKTTLYDRISKNTKNLFAKTNFFENILLNIIERRFTISGLMVKNLLIEDHLLEKQCQFLKHLYLFFDDMIFPFYRRLFEKTESSSKNWANDIWLTSHLHDIFMDVYPEFYEKCSVQMKEGWSLCTDSLSVCGLININYEMPWPLNIIIKQEQMDMYKGIFQFLLKLKWALHTINHLVFSDLELNEKSLKKSQKIFKETNYKNKATAKLIRLKFCLINILNSLQHFVFSFVFGRNLMKFELNFEKAYDLNSLIESHSDFIQSVSGTIKDLNEIMLEKHKNSNILSCVKLLKLMWNDLRYATLERLNECNKMYSTFYSDISPIVFPVYIYDY